MPTINGTSGNDSLTGTDDNDTINGLEGDDTIDAGFGDDEIRDGIGNDTAYGGSGDDDFYGSAGDDFYDGGDHVLGDTVIYIDALAGVRVDLSAPSNQARSVGAGDSAGIGVDQLVNIENVFGSNFADELIGNSEANGLIGFDGDDILRGGAGNDGLSGWAGNDVLDGGDGVDRAIYSQSTTGVHVSLAISGPQDTGQGIDTLIDIENILGSNFNDVLIGNETANYITGGGGQDEIYGGAGDDLLRGNGSVYGEAGNDDIFGRGRLDGGAGNDVIRGSTGNGQLFGGDGTDALEDYSGGDDYLDGGAGADYMSGGNGNDTYVVDDPGDVASEWSGVDGGIDIVLSSISFSLVPPPGEAIHIENLTLTGSSNIDGTGNVLANIITGNAGSNYLYGLGGNDVIDGDSGDDTIDGGSGDDTLSGGAGIDSLAGGTGNDLFRDTAAGLNGDRIADFTAGDRIIISDVNPATFTYSLSGNTLTYSGGTLTLTGFSGQLTASEAIGGGVQLTVAGGVANDADHDFNGDGRSDLAWRNADGSFTSWLGQPNGSFTANPGSGANALDTSWRIVGVGDFNGDGRDDILWRHNGGEIGQWLGQSSGMFINNGGAAANAVDNSWAVVGIADYNGDGRDDILWRHTSGEVGQWVGQPSGGFANNGGAAANAVDPSWTVVANGDFNGDSRADVLWRHSSGVYAEWQGSATGALVNAGSVLAGATGSVVGAGDFNGDGREDVLMRAGNGAITVWLGQASGQFTSFSPTSQVLDLNWRIAGIGDYNGDGRDDLVWRHTSGAGGEWLATGTGDFANNGAIPTVDTSWQIQSPDIWMV